MVDKPVQTRKNGRPSDLKAAENKKKCQLAFTQGLSILKAAEKYELNKETVCNYYKVLKEELINKLDTDFVIDQKTAKQFSMKKLEDTIDELDAAAKTAFDKKEDDKAGAAWYGHYIKCVELKSSLEQLRYSIEMAPTIDVSIEKIMEESIEEVDKSKPQSDSTK